MLVIYAGDLTGPCSLKSFHKHDVSSPNLPPLAYSAAGQRRGSVSCNTLRRPPRLSAAHQATVVTVVNPQRAGMWGATFSRPHNQGLISLVPVLTLIITKTETITGTVFCGLESLWLTGYLPRQKVEEQTLG